LVPDNALTAGLFAELSWDWMQTGAKCPFAGQDKKGSGEKASKEGSGGGNITRDVQGWPVMARMMLV